MPSISSTPKALPLGKMIVFITIRVGDAICPRASHFSPSEGTHENPALATCVGGTSWVTLGEQTRVICRECRSRLITSRSASSAGSLYFQELDANRRAHIQHFARGCQMAGFRVDAKHDDVVRFLVLRKKKLAGRIDPETARDFALRRCVFDRRQRAFAG